jgi:hypothetical protein
LVEAVMQRYIWHYKDGHRMYWRVTLEDSGERRMEDEYTIHSIWDCTFERSPHGEGEDDWQLITECSLIGQYDVAPNLLHVVQAFMNNFLDIGIGMVAYLETHPAPIASVSASAQAQTSPRQATQSPQEPQPARPAEVPPEADPERRGE